MKVLLIGLLTLTTLSAIASEYSFCELDYREQKIYEDVTMGTSETPARYEKSYIIIGYKDNGMSEPIDRVVETYENQDDDTSGLERKRDRMLSRIEKDGICGSIDD